MPSVFVLGGARSGKSAYAQSVAEQRVEQSGGDLVMIATAEALDAEMADRIIRHRSDRDARWRTIEAPLELVEAIDSLGGNDIAVVDCLTLWLSNLMGQDADLGGATASLISALARAPAMIILVSNEVGQGIVPDNALARRFRDEAGRLHQAVATACDHVVFVIAGLPLILKPAPAPS